MTMCGQPTALARQQGVINPVVNAIRHRAAPEGAEWRVVK